MIEIYPNDVLLFRESRDFSAGEGHVAVTTEPLPHTIAGALMAVAFESGAFAILNLEGSNDEVRKPENWRPGFSILGTFFALNGSPVFSLPKDVVSVKGEDGIEHLVPVEPAETPVGEVVVAPVSDETRTLHFKPARCFVSASELSRYLAGKLREFTEIDVGRVYTLEERIGIGLTEGKVTEEGLLYRTLNLRMSKEASIQVYFEENEEGLISAIGKEGLIKLGGESRFARFVHVERDFPFSGTLHVEKGSMMRLYFATPLIPNGSLESLLREMGINADVVRVFTDRKVRVTGWDMMAKMPKATLYAYPAGTVVWLRAIEDLEVERVQKAGLMREFGYGLTIAGEF
ncbi:type III-B CRISPR module-associated protein Cmr3 [Thermococcus henrietii]|uniref:type III-B CRISPR module-associated protein Cmr3 n=1 Tax=Thermococcus henrietii TaxID=2016361 RepID=UPI000C07147B|nr:type III-B CRISPR module-associated protein Cmr3 [Thermococcus henrietii]